MRQVSQEHFDQLAWYEEGLAMGELDLHNWPVHARPGDSDWEDFDQGWRDGQKNLHGEEDDE